jgi:hypothetical protein
MLGCHTTVEAVYFGYSSRVFMFLCSDMCNCIIIVPYIHTTSFDATLLLSCWHVNELYLVLCTTVHITVIFIYKIM